MLASFGVFPISVAVGAVVVHNFGPALLFPLAAAILVAAILAGLSQRCWRDLGATGSATTPANQRRMRGNRRGPTVPITADAVESAS